jgi:hypothetical protein
MENENLEGYTEVKQRVLEFRESEKYKGYKSITEIISSDDNYAIMKASILNEKNEVVATGHAKEVKDELEKYENSYLEICETSAIGRALGFLGIGISKSIASLDEIRKEDEVLDAIAGLDNEFSVSAYYNEHIEKLEGSRKKEFNKLITKRKRELK